MNYEQRTFHLVLLGNSDLQIRYLGLPQMIIDYFLFRLKPLEKMACFVLTCHVDLTGVL